MAEAWTREQSAAITDRRHLLLAANAGTGKTTTVVGKILWRLGYEIPDSIDGPVPACDEPCDIDEIAAITFTEKAAQDLRRKLQQALVERGADPGDLDRAYVGTIHGFCAEILRQHALRLDIDPSFRVLDAREAALRLTELVRDTVLDALERGDEGVIELLKDAPLDRFDAFGTSVTDLVRWAMRDLRWHRDRYEAWLTTAPETPAPELVLDRDVIQALGPDSAGDKPDAARAEDRYLGHTVAVFRLAYRALGAWLTLLDRENRRDFDSLVLDVRRLLTRERFAPALATLRARHRLLVVDEFQDTDTAQRDIVFAIGGVSDTDPGATPQTQLCLVGDPKQSIYRFRGADVRVWNEVDRQFREIGSVLRLGANFRCDPSLVELVNRVCEPAFEDAGTALFEGDPSAVVPYDPMDPAVEDWRGAGIEWLAVDAEGSAAARSRNGARTIAGRIEAMLRPDGGTRVRSGSERGRSARPSDIAVLALTRKTLGQVEEALRERGIPCWNAASTGLAERQEVLDAVNALRLADNPRDDLRAFGFLRSPFVGLRDEVIARIRLEPDLPRGGLLERADAWLRAVKQGRISAWPSPESDGIEPTERETLERGLAAIRAAHDLVGRAEPAEILEGLLRATPYRLHLELRDRAQERLANLERLKTVLRQYRSLSLNDFLVTWDRAAVDRDADLAAAVLPSAAEGAVLLTTVHSAKGLEWPIVFLANAEDGERTQRPGRLTGWTDHELGPVLLPAAKERGARSERAEQRRTQEDGSESARLLYVALTRARDRLVIAAPLDAAAGHAGWIASAVTDAGPFWLVDADSHGPANVDARAYGGERHAAADDPGTGTGRQLDAFGLHDPEEDERGQLNLLSPRNAGARDEPGPDGRSNGGGIPVEVRRNVEPLQPELDTSLVPLGWLESLESMPPPPAVGPLPQSQAARLRSATEMAQEREDPSAWELRFVHGVTPVEQFAAAPGRAESTEERAGSMDRSDLAARARGTIVHSVLERLVADPAAGDLERLLDEAIGEVGEDETFLPSVSPGSEARQLLREEIDSVLQNDSWRELVSGAHYRELPFVHLTGSGEWRQGRIDLFVPPRTSGASVDADARVIDFKTGRVEGGVQKAADRYAIQAEVYEAAVRAILGDEDGVLPGGGVVRVRFHFTRPNQQVEVGTDRIRVGGELGRAPGQETP